MILDETENLATHSMNTYVHSQPTPRDTIERKKLETAKRSRVHNDAMVAVLEEKGVSVPEVSGTYADVD